MDIRTISKEELLDSIKRKDFAHVRDIFDTVQNIDIADALNEIDINDNEEFKYMLMLFKIVKTTYSAEVFSELDTEHQEKLVSVLNDSQISDLFDEISNDDITDFLEEMPANLVQKILKNTNNEDRKKINQLLGYKEDTAGSIMTTEYLTLLEDDTVSKSIETIRKIGKNAETIYTLFVRNKKWDLVGVLNLDDLIFARDEEKLIDICDTNFQTVNVNCDQEEVAQLFKRYDLNAIGVTNDDNKLTGIITIDDIVDVIEEENTEDMVAMAQVTPLEDSYTKTPVLRLVYKCVPWLVVLLILNIGSMALQNEFQDMIGLLTVISVFLTMVCDTGGNSGSQSSTLIIRGLSTQDFTLKDYGKIIRKELLTALITGLIFGAVSFLWILFMFGVGIIDIPEDNLANIPDTINTWCAFSGCISVTLFLTIIISKFIGASLPFLITKMKLDPAVISSPLITTIMDVVSLGLYFALLFLFAYTGAFGVNVAF